MRVRIELRSDRKGRVDYNYQYYLASALYDKFHKANEELASRVHYKKGFKFFNFSNLMFDDYKCDKEGISFEGKAWFVLASPDKEIMTALVEGALKDAVFDIKGTKLMVNKVGVLAKPELGQSVAMRTLSPIITTTKREIEGKLKTWDLSPSELQFHTNIRNNMIKKFPR